MLFSSNWNLNEDEGGAKRGRKEKSERERKKMYFDKRSPLINYTVEATIVYFTAVVLTAVAGEKDQTTTTSSSISSRRSVVVCGTRSTKCCTAVRLLK